MDQSWIELIELCLKVLAVLGAGVWAFTALRVLTNSDTANASLRKQAVVSVDIKPAVQRSMDGDGYVITAVVELANRGAQNTTINWKDQPPAFHVRLAKFDADGKPKYDPPTRFRVPLSLNPRSGAVSMSFAPARPSRSKGMESPTALAALALPSQAIMIFWNRGPLSQFGGMTSNGRPVPKSIASIRFWSKDKPFPGRATMARSLSLAAAAMLLQVSACEFCTIWKPALTSATAAAAIRFSVSCAY
jgi:hypothetical protein